MIPDDPEDMHKVALELEAHAHKLGWDQPPVAGVIYDVGEGYRTASIPIPLPDVHPQPRVALSMLAEMFRQTREARADIDEETPEDIRSMLAGLWLIHEAWMNAISPEERGGRSLADIPGSKEVRGVMLLDCGGRLTWARRIRGEQPAVQEADHQITGALPQAMAELLLEQCRSLPDDAYDKAAIEAWVKD